MQSLWPTLPLIQATTLVVQNDVKVLVGKALKQASGLSVQQEHAPGIVPSVVLFSAWAPKDKKPNWFTVWRCYR